jgi:hypothetical protein
MKTARTVSLFVASALLTGCAGPTLREQVYAHLEANARAYSVPAVSIVQGLPDNGRPAQAREDMRNDAAVAREWVHGDRTKRVTTAGPVLPGYGKAGASGFTEVARCTIDVSLVVTDGATREKFIRMCYELLPKKNRDLIYESSERSFCVDCCKDKSLFR